MLQLSHRVNNIWHITQVFGTSACSPVTRSEQRAGLSSCYWSSCPTVVCRPGTRFP